MNETSLRQLLADEESYGLEFKAARDSYSRPKLNDYCAALANENGGHLLLGVNNAKRIVGTNAFSGNWNRLAHEITNELQLRIKVYEIKVSEGRVLAFEVPRHITGTPVQVKGGTGVSLPDTQWRVPGGNGSGNAQTDIR